MKILRKFIDLVLYSSLWIALCTAAQVQLTYYLTGFSEGFDHYTLFVFTSTIALYGLHRLVGIRIVRAFEHEGRFAVIKQYRTHILVYSIIGFIAAGVFLLQLPPLIWIYLIVPIAISAAYVIPTRKSGKRLRDFPFIKIFLVAASWSLLTTTVPLLNQGFAGPLPLFLIFLERFLFVFAITIPFDIRDMRVDTGTGVRTLPHVLGETRSKILALLLLILSVITAAFLMAQGVYSLELIWPYLLFFLITTVLIWGARIGRGDYYYSGLVDGTMLVLYVLAHAWLALSP